MTKIIFMWYLITGVITPSDKVDNRPTYTIKQNNFSVDYAYKGEIYNWIETHKFQYNEDFKD